MTATYATFDWLDVPTSWLPRAGRWAQCEACKTYERRDDVRRALSFLPTFMMLVSAKHSEGRHYREMNETMS